MKDGMLCSGSIPHDYKRKPDDKQTLIVDEPAAEVVRKIFRLVCQGNSTTAIAEMLTEEKVLIRSAYAALNQPKNCRQKNVADPYRWSATTVGHILDRQEYLGHTVLGKSICENFKTKQRRAAMPDELMIFPDTHEAIIDQDTWDIARKIRSKKKSRVANGTYSPPSFKWRIARTAWSTTRNGRMKNMTLTKYEKETIILFNESEDTAHIQTYNAGLRKRLEAFSRKSLIIDAWKNSSPRAA